MTVGCCAPVGACGLSHCSFCGDSFDPFAPHLEFPEDDGGALVICAQCVPELIAWAEVQGPPGCASVLRQVWYS